MAGLFQLLPLETAVVVSMAAPLVAFFVVALLDRSPNLREAASITAGLVTFYCAVTIFIGVGDGARPEIDIVEMLPGLSLKLAVEPLGALFGLIASGLWVVNTCYSIGYMRGHHEGGQTRFYMAFCVAISAALGIAYAGNLLTFFLFYEALTLSTFPLVTHERDEAARAGGRVYLGILMGTSIGLLLPAVVWVYGLTGTTDFALGGILGQVSANMPLVFSIIVCLFAWGTAKAALMPFHPWLPNAMVAPTPVSAFLHAVAVVKAGVFGVLKISIYTLGAVELSQSAAADIITYVAAASILIASAIAMTQDNLKARLAYSTVSQLSYVTLGAMIASRYGILGGGAQIAAHALGKMTLFMCAGAIAVAHHKKYISEMRGLGRVMPYTFTAYIIGACSIIGLPPFAGTWPKFLLMLGSIETGDAILVGVLILSSLMNIVYLLTPAVRAFMDPVPGNQAAEIKEAPAFCLFPPWFTAIGCLVLFFYMGDIIRYLEPLVEGL
ncbi:proton-conducting transporter transmembrane domain-containing protein [Parvularcula lutaonensis]|uniref:Proton-conducting transporter membrane subunit n=1 Tax=Parvularcula lutaonensis TaxID=491923 RepID=A0ABV7ME79_9PROT|nr:proton-conducting transporter membrane subunit [Parvularcula lutaonensis]GGY54764.1 cation:proton antiporter [Parvularcula lutaonensis]